jgi:hypothetical protein
VLLNAAERMTGYFVEGIDGTVPLSKLNGTDTARIATPASDACESSLYTS